MRWAVRIPGHEPTFLKFVCVALTLTALIGCIPRIAPAQMRSGALSGRLTDLHSRPIAGATVIVRDVAGKIVLQATTGRNGAYRIAGLEPGEYVLEAADAQGGRGSLEGIVIVPGQEAHMQTAMALERPTEPELARAKVELGVRPSLPDPASADSAAQLPEAVDHSIAPVLISEPVPNVPAYSAPITASLVQEPMRSLPLPSGLRDPDSIFVKQISQWTPPRPAPAPETEPPTISAMLELAAPLRLDGLRSAMPSPAITAAAHNALLTAVAYAASQAAMLPRFAAAAQNRDPQLEAKAPTLTADQLDDLPIAGRHWEIFAHEAASSRTRSSEAEEDDVTPATIAAGTISLDGTDTRSAFDSAHRSAPGSQTPALAIQEVQPSTVEFGMSAPGVRIETRGGGQRLHGSAFAFTRQKLGAAQNPFSQWVKETTPGTINTSPVFTAFPFTPEDRETSWGMGIGGSLHHKGPFWFAALERSQRNDPAVATVRHPDDFFAQPSNDEMQVLSARLDLSSANPVAAGLAAYSTALESLAGLLGPAPRESSRWSSFARLDWAPAERHRITLEGTGFSWNAPGGGLTSASAPYGSHSFGSSRIDEESLQAHWDWFLSPNLILVTRASAQRHISSRPAEKPSPFEQSLNATPWKDLPQMVVDARYGFTIGNPARFGEGSHPDEHNYALHEELGWAHGPLLLKAGFDLRHSSDATGFVRNHAGTYHYARLANFISDALSFTKFGLNGQIDPRSQHNCDERGKAWRDAGGQLHGVGYLPCYAYYTQTLGPTSWHLSTNDWAGYASAQLQPAKSLVLSASVRWQHQELPPPIALVTNPELPQTQKLPPMGSEWAPRVSLALGERAKHWPVLQLGYGMYFGRTENSVLQTVLTQTGSLQGDLRFLMRPADNLQGNGGGAPPFPYVLSGAPSMVEKPAAVAFAPSYRNGEVHQAVVALEKELPGHVLVNASAEVSLGRRLPVAVDTNVDPATNPGTITYAVVDASGKGPLKSPQITVPFFATWPTATGTSGRLNRNYQQITQLISGANSTYEAATLRLSRNARHGLSFRARYTYGHALDWNPDESDQVIGSSVFDPGNFRQEYGTSNLDVRHSASTMILWEAPRKLRNGIARLANGWMLSGTAQFRSGLPYTMRTAGSIPRELTTTGTLVEGLGPGMLGYGGDDRVYGVGRNTYRYPPTWKADLRVGRRFTLGHEQELRVMAESFNLFNHQNVTRIETIGYSIENGSAAGELPTLNFLTGLKNGQTEFGKPLNVNATDYYRPRQIDFGLQYRF